MDLDEEEYYILMKPLGKSRTFKLSSKVPIGENIVIAWKKR